METSGGKKKMKPESKMIIAFLATNARAANIQASSDMKRMEKKNRRKYKGKRKRKE